MRRFQSWLNDLTNGMPDAPNWLLLVMLIIFALVMLFVYRSQAQLPQTEQRYMLLYTGASGLNLDCVDEYPYVDTRRMDWNGTSGFTEIDGSYVHLLSIIAVESCNIDNVYSFDDNLFVWRMTDIECERNRCAVHVNRGAWWIEAR